MNERTGTEVELGLKYCSGMCDFYDFVLVPECEGTGTRPASILQMDFYGLM